MFCFHKNYFIKNTEVLCCFRDLVTEECDLELILTKAFLEVDKALQKHLKYTPNGRFFHVR